MLSWKDYSGMGIYGFDILAQNDLEKMDTQQFNQHILFHNAIRHNDLQILQSLLHARPNPQSKYTHIDYTRVDSNYMTLLQYAVHIGNKQIIQYLLQSGCDPNYPYFGLPLLHMAVGHAGTHLISYHSIQT